VNTAKTVAVLPARYGSTRFPGKPLAIIAGKTMIERVYCQVAKAKEVDEVVVATDDERIVEAVTAFGGKAVMTSPDHQTGTDRIAEAISDIDADIVVNAQGDEPLLSPDVIDQLVGAMRSSGAKMGTVAVPFGLTGKSPADPNSVKVVVDGDSRAIYFSRAPIPFCRSGGVAVEPLLHWGLYAYRRDFLETFIRWPRGQLEACEMLEQLRAVEQGVRIFVVRASVPSIGVDVPEDVAIIEKILKQQGECD